MFHVSVSQPVASFVQPADSFSLIHDPRNEFNKLYTVDKLGNIWGGRPVLCESYRPSYISIN